jgi:hypothetical protein
MYAIAVVAICAALIAAYTTLTDAQMAFVPAASAQALALNMGEYRQAVIDYVLQAGPGFQGSVPAAKLSAVANYMPNPLWANYVQGNLVVVYATSMPSSEVVSDIATLAQGSVLAGSALNGSEVSPGDATPAIPLPAAIAAAVPNGAPVWLAQVYPS